MRSALDAHDEIELVRLFTADARLIVDAGDPTGGEWRGRASVARILLDRLADRQDVVFDLVDVNGGPGVSLRGAGGRVIGVVALGIDATGLVEAVWVTTAPRKLTSWNPDPPDPPDPSHPASQPGRSR
ncbi:hypothetical protein [Agromyces sp. LHK192]|uniref:hypothetical protein n=1 Tax=Agromyces sp. LHK192 TaxID=2498704 RepID=UPI000FDB475C|nr:hypothetical protein [Agromyces sp. LHK192]